MEEGIRVSARMGLFCLLLFVVFQGQSLRAQGSGGGGGKQGTVTSITEGAGIDLTPNTITTTGSVGIAAGGVSNDMLAGGITNDKLAGSITNDKLAGGITNEKLAGSIDPTKVTGTAATLGANFFTATQTINSGNIDLPATTGYSSGMLTIGGSPFLHGWGGFSNTFVGVSSGNVTMGGVNNTGLGYSTLVANTTGVDNTAIGREALMYNTEGYGNTAVGFAALGLNTGAQGNTAVGWHALRANTSAGSFSNTAVGTGALHFADGVGNVGIGSGAGNLLPAGHSYNLYIDNAGAAEDSTIRIGGANHMRTFIAGISNVTTEGAGTPVYVDANGQLGTAPSSRRFKYDIRDMDEATEKMLQLRPVVFRYKQAQENGSHPLQYGLIAEEVAEVYPEMVQRSVEGEANAVLYQFLPAMLLNEVQKQHRQIDAQQERIRSLEGQLQQLAAETRQLQIKMAAFEEEGGRGESLALVRSRQ